MSSYILHIGKIADNDFHHIGGKSIGLEKLSRMGIKIPKSTVLTTSFFTDVLDDNNIPKKLYSNPQGKNDLLLLRKKINKIIFSPEKQKIIDTIYSSFKGNPVAVRSSCIYEDLPHASFSGLYKSVINVNTREKLEDAIRYCYVNTYSLASWEYFKTRKLSPKGIAMALVIQETIYPLVSGVIFTTHPELKTNKIMLIEANFGFGQSVVNNEIIPDRFLFYTPTQSIITKELGKKTYYFKPSFHGGLEKENNVKNDLCLDDRALIKLGRFSEKISKTLEKPQDIEFALTQNGECVFLQTRDQLILPKNYNFVSTKTNKKPDIIGKSFIPGITYGKLLKKGEKIKSGDIVFADEIDVTDIHAIKNAGGLLLTHLSLGSHVASLLRELQIPTIVEPKKIIDELFRTHITLDTTNPEGKIYKGNVPFKSEKQFFNKLDSGQTKIFVGCSNPSLLAKLQNIPLDGIGLIRSEFIISQEIGIHPLALVAYDKNKLDKKLAKKIKDKISPYRTGSEYYIHKLSSTIAQLLALLDGKSANYRLSDFQSDTYKGLLGGEQYEHIETNPMMGFRGTTRLISEEFADALALELEALNKVVHMGFTNLRIMFPFCRIPEDAQVLKGQVKKYITSDIQIGMMVEVPSNIFLAKEFAKIVDFFFIGPRDLTQSVYGADRMLSQLTKYTINSEAVIRAVETFLFNIKGEGKEIFVALFDLFQHIQRFKKIQSNNKLYFSGSPNTILKDFRNIAMLEKKTLPPKTVFIFGPTGAGKNYVANILQKNYDYHFLDADTLFTKDMMQIIKTKGVITEKMRQEFIDAIVTKTKVLMKKYKKLVITQALIKDQHRQYIALHIPEIQWVFLQTRSDIRYKRLEKRKNHFADISYAKIMDNLYEDPTIPYILIKNNKSEIDIEKQLKKIFAE